jgi:2-polyprenyl-6-methoxyphenol hydroxylase-like FAD-dependent oxidoreductase
MCCEVIIAGGSPVGLFLAGELALAGVSVLLFEKNQNLSGKETIRSQAAALQTSILKGETASAIC